MLKQLSTTIRRPVVTTDSNCGSHTNTTANSNYTTKSVVVCTLDVEATLNNYLATIRPRNFGNVYNEPINKRVEFVCDALVPRDSIVMLEFLEVRL